MHIPGTTWLLAELKRGGGSIADWNLKQQSFSTFLPLEEVTIRHARKFTRALRPLFPGYIFVAATAERQYWRAINSTYGVKRLVTFRDAPAVVPLDVICRLLLRCDASGKLLPPRLLKPGDQVRLTSGPFADFVATVETIAPDRRVWVLLELMGVLTSVVVPHEGMRLV